MPRPRRTGKPSAKSSQPKRDNAAIQPTQPDHDLDAQEVAVPNASQPVRDLQNDEAELQDEVQNDLHHPTPTKQPEAKSHSSIPDTDQRNVSDEPASHLNPVVDAVRVDPDLENEKLRQAAAKRRKIAQKLLDKPDLSDLLESNPVSDDDDDPDEIITEMPSVEPLQLIEDENRGSAHGEVSESEETEERVIGTVSISSTDEDADPIRTDDLDQFKTAKIKSSMKRLCREMDKCTERFIKAHDECSRIRNEYAIMASQHARLTANMHLRRVLNITRHVQRPLNAKDSNKVEIGQKLRSGKIIKKEEPENLDKADDAAFQYISKDMMKTFKKNIVNTQDPKEIAMVQVFQERCAVCGRFFKSKRGLDSHLVKHTNMSFKCKLCTDRNFTAQIAFKKHLRWHRDGEVYHYCDFIVNTETQEKCDKRFEWATGLESHKLSHYPPSKPCRVHEGCEAIYTYDCERLKHERTGTARKIYKCEDCNTTFKDDLNRVIHMGRYHTRTSKHYIDPAHSKDKPKRRKRQISSSKPECSLSKKAKTRQTVKTASSATSTTTTPPISRRNLSVNDPNLAIPLIPDMSSESALDTTVGSSSEYVPSTSTSAETEDTLPDIC